MFAERTRWNLGANRLSEALALQRRSERALLDLTASNPTECGFHYEQEAILKALAHPQALKYHPDPRGLKSAREAVCSYYAGMGIKVAVEDLVLTTSTSEAYSFVFRLLANPGDEVLIPTPSYPLFDFLADIQDVNLVRYPLFYDHGWHIDFHKLEQSITGQTRGIIVVHPNNPTGHFTWPEEIDRLNQICSKNSMVVIADEVFLDFGLKAERPRAFAGNGETLTFTLSGISKISALPQMKLAWLLVSGPDKQIREAMARLEVIADTYLSLNTPIQLAASILLDQRHVMQPQLMERVRRNLSKLDSQLAGQKLCSRLEVEGGWYVVLRVPATRSDEEWAIELLEQHDVYVHPGHFYGFPTDGYLVVSLIAREVEFADGITRVLSCVSK
jgi:aspartate/methionine/tyrosine aminotransferase